MIPGNSPEDQAELAAMLGACTDSELIYLIEKKHMDAAADELQARQEARRRIAPINTHSRLQGLGTDQAPLPEKIDFDQWLYE